MNLLNYLEEAENRKHDTDKTINVNKCANDTNQDTDNGNSCKNADKEAENNTDNEINNDVDNELCNVARLKCKTPNLFQNIHNQTPFKSCCK